MSRLDSNSPALSCLPRRRFLKTLTAAPLAAVAVPEPGQAFSSHHIGDARASLQAAISADARFARFDDLVAQIVDLDLRQEEAFAEYDSETISWCTDESNDDGASPWVVLHNSLQDELGEFASANRHPAADILDVMLQWKIADYYFAIGDVGFDDVDESCPSAARHGLEFWGIKPQVPIEDLRKKAPIHVERQERYAARVVPTPLRVNAGNALDQIRDVGAAHIAAIAHEARQRDGTAKAMATSDRRRVELNRIRDEIFKRRPLTDESPWHFGQLEDFVVWIELLKAYSPEFWKGSACVDADAALILQKLAERARETADELVEHAQWWTAKNGGANV